MCVCVCVSKLCYFVAPIETQITPKQRICDFGTRVELECAVSGYPHQMIYWLHNAKLVSPLHQVRRETHSSSSTSRGVGVVSERLLIASFGLEDTGVYQCVAESSADDVTTLSSSSSTVSDLIGVNGKSRQKNRQSSLKRAGQIVEAIKPGPSVGDLVDNAQDTTHLIMGS